jgi:membrane protease YdiL (CAAX protease family)
MIGIPLAVALVAYNNLANRVPAFHGWAYLPMNLFVATSAVWAAMAVEGVNAATLGLHHRFLEDTLAGLSLGLIPILLAAPLLLRPRTLHLLADPRMRQIGTRQALFLVLLRIPLGTALTEELIFRGVLLALFSPLGVGGAVMASSVAFGLWHIMPGINRHRAGNPQATRRELAAAATVAIVLTVAAGAVLGWIRIASGGLGVSFGIHTAVNDGGALLAITAFRRLKTPPEDRPSHDSLELDRKRPARE